MNRSSAFVHNPRKDLRGQHWVLQTRRFDADLAVGESWMDDDFFNSVGRPLAQKVGVAGKTATHQNTMRNATQSRVITSLLIPTLQP